MKKPSDFTLTREKLETASDAMLTTLIDLGQRALSTAEAKRDRRYFEIKSLLDDVSLELEWRIHSRKEASKQQTNLFARAQ